MKSNAFSGPFNPPSRVTLRSNVPPPLGSPRRVELRGGASGGNIEWWMYQQTFIPQLYFARPRVYGATLGQKKPPPPGVCCQKTPDGGAICSTGQGFPPG